MKALLDGAKQNPWAAGSLIAVLLALPNLEKGMDVVSRYYNAPTVAEAAQQQVEQTDEKLTAYMQAQTALIGELRGYVQAQQARPHTTPSRQWDPQAQRWMCCDDSPAVCWRDATWYWCD